MLSDIRRLLGRILILSAPLILVTIAYVALDPFRIIYAYPDYYDRNYPLVLNRDFVSTQLYLNHPDRAKIDSFIFGSSHSLAFRADDWRSFVGARYAFHYDAFAESLYGIERKVRFLEREGAHIRHALVVLDSDVLAVTANSPGHIFIKDPRVSGESRLAFHGEFLKAFAFPSFLLSYLRYRISGRPLMDKISMEAPGSATKDTNDLEWTERDAEIRRDAPAFFARLLPKMPKRDASPLPRTAVIGEAQERMLREIRRIFDKDKTDYRIVASPSWRQRALNPADVEKLRRIFGGENVFDFSGPSAASSDIRNFYDISEHFRPVVGHAIMEEIYRAPR
jgi:hypothetical protein